MSVQSELESLRNQNGGILKPDVVVEFAKDPSTALHSRFTWDDNKAAYEYRLWQAREIIRVEVTVIESTNEPIRAYVSLQEDRVRPGGGYRSMVDVMTDDQRRESLISQALSELNRVREKYKTLKELAPVYAAMDAVAKKRKRKLQTA